MVVKFPSQPRRRRLTGRTSLEELLCSLHEAGDDEDLQAAVDRIAEGERAAVLATLKKLCGMLDQRPSSAAPDAIYIPY